MLPSTNLLAASAVGLALGYYLGRSTSLPAIIPSPQVTLLPKLSDDERKLIPYPPDVLPGRRQVDTPWGTINVYEWGPEDGEKVLLVHGISTPCLALADLAQELVNSGYRVMLFDLFGRGFSDNPVEFVHDKRLFTTQILLVVTSSPLPWTGAPGFHLIGYSLGGGISAGFTRHYPHLVRSLTMIAPAGLIRQSHIGWRTRLLTSGLLPSFVIEYLMKQRLKPATKVEQELEKAEEIQEPAFNNGAVTHISKYYRPNVTIIDVISWQILNHKGYPKAFTSSLMNGPIVNQHKDWSIIASRLTNPHIEPRLRLENDKLLFVLGKDDAVILTTELVEDATAIFGDRLEVRILPGTHELPTTNAKEVANAAMKFWAGEV